MLNLRPTLVTAGLVVTVTSSLFGQAEPAALAGPVIDTTAAVLVVDHDFAAAGEIVRIFLQAK